MKRTPLKRVSRKQEYELLLRRALKAELMLASGFKCMTCGKFCGTNLDLSHIIPLSRGGKTSIENCVVECRGCHLKYEKKPHLRPAWQRDKYNIKGE